jgi:hypothetical protein
LEEAFLEILWRLLQIGRSIFLGRIFGRIWRKSPNSLLQKKGSAFAPLQPLCEPLLVVLGLGIIYPSRKKRSHLCIYSLAPSEIAARQDLVGTQFAGIPLWKGAALVPVSPQLPTLYISISCSPTCLTFFYFDPPVCAVHASAFDSLLI